MTGAEVAATAADGADRSYMCRVAVVGFGACCGSNEEAPSVKSPLQRRCSAVTISDLAFIRSAPVASSNKGLSASIVANYRPYERVLSDSATTWQDEAKDRETAQSADDAGVRGMDIIMGSNNGVGDRRFFPTLWLLILSGFSVETRPHRLVHYTHTRDILDCCVD
jgi:hypothetical protein